MEPETSANLGGSWDRQIDAAAKLQAAVRGDIAPADTPKVEEDHALKQNETGNKEDEAQDQFKDTMLKLPSTISEEFSDAVESQPEKNGTDEKRSSMKEQAKETAQPSIPSEGAITGIGRGRQLRSSPRGGRQKRVSRPGLGARFKSSAPKKTASTIQGYMTRRISTLNLLIPPEQEGSSSLSGQFSCRNLLDIENGTVIKASRDSNLDKHRFQELDEHGAIIMNAAAPIAREDENFFSERHEILQEKIQSGDIRRFATTGEAGCLGGAWRGLLRRILLLTLDEVNALRFTRQLQLALPFLTGHETYLVGQVIEALDFPIVKKEVALTLKVAFQNRNVSRIMVQTLFTRWDYLWHLADQVYANRRYAAFGELPFIGFTGFPATENFPATRLHVINASLRVLLGEGLWLTRVLTSNRQGLVTDHPERIIAQNLAAESIGFETANRNQFGNYFGRERTNEFRVTNRLPTDESILRTFVRVPMSTMVNNGAVHTLRQIANHWHNILYQKEGNFAHQRMEQLDPFETMRFHIPVVCVVLSSLRGRVRWDSEVLGPFMKKCQDLKPGFGIDQCRKLAQEMNDKIALNLSAGVPSILDPLLRWIDTILMSCDAIEKEALLVYEKISVVDIGLRLGYDLITQVNWKLPSDSALKNAILNHIRGRKSGNEAISDRLIHNALQTTTPRDKRTLMELVNNGFQGSKPAQLLLGRVKTLLQREIRRDALDKEIRNLSFGETTLDLVKDEWYWLDDGERKAVYSYVGKVMGKDEHRLIHVDSGLDRLISWPDESIKFNNYIPVAEAITRAQKCFMNIELEHGKKFKYNAFMEFSFLRIALRRLAIISQIFCDELDNARLNVLREVQKANKTQIAVSHMEEGSTYYVYEAKTKSYKPFTCRKKYTSADPEWQVLAKSKILKTPPQSMLVVGGGPTGLITVVHCTENVLVSGGVMKLYEARDAFNTGASTFERAQIVRLDARWIAMLRYHLGTGFENIYIPAAGETDAQLGNTLPDQGFVEITIKDLENMLHVEVSKLWSKGLIECYTDSRAQYDLESNSLTKQGQHLKLNDQILRRVDPQGKLSDQYFSWKVADFTYARPLQPDEIVVGREYGIFVAARDKIMPYFLLNFDASSDTYTFKSPSASIAKMKVTRGNWPSIFEQGVQRDGEVASVILESVQKKGSGGGVIRETLPMKHIRTFRFTLDVGHTHVVECIGKPRASSVHFNTATTEPYGVCCIQGLKISMGMHNFGEKRWGSGLLDDFRSTNDQNTRIIGDFTKVVNQPQVAAKMVELMNSYDWGEHFKKVIADSKFQSLNDFDPVLPRLRDAVEEHAKKAPTFNRMTLQTRFFETGDNYYLGMEFTREYEDWKKETVEEIVRFSRIKKLDETATKDLQRCKGALNHHIDRLWYEACLEVIRQGDVYNPGARTRVPKLYTISSHTQVPLGSLDEGEAFRVADDPKERYEVLLKSGLKIVVRNVEGCLKKMGRGTRVLREGDLTRAPDGNQESRVALATFPVSHYANHRTLRLNNESLGYVFAFIGDEQSTPHFMRYSGLTGACINAMAFNTFIQRAISCQCLASRFVEYSTLTDWSNSEVLTRGFGTNYGRDGFLRPGFTYSYGVNYLYEKVIEFFEKEVEPSDILSRDWKAKFAASMVPRGMETNQDFLRALRAKTRDCILDKFLAEIKKDKSLVNGETLAGALAGKREMLAHSGAQPEDRETYWNHFVSETELVDPSALERVREHHVEIATRIEQAIGKVIAFAHEGYLNDTRIASEMFRQPKPVDSIVDDYAVEAQNFANSLAMSVAFSAGALALVLLDEGNVKVDNAARIFGSILGAWNISISFTTMTNVSRYKIRNEEGRILYFEQKHPSVRKGVYAMLPREARESLVDENPFLEAVGERVRKFLYDAKYYGAEDPAKSGFKASYEELLAHANDPAAIRRFQKEIAGNFLPGAYQQNSFLQESLVDIYRTCEEMAALLEAEERAPPELHGPAMDLFARLTAFGPRLEASLQRGHIYWGFLKHRRFVHWDIVVVFRYFYSLLFCASPRGNSRFAPVQIETLGLLKQAEALGRQGTKEAPQRLQREIRDLSYLYWSTRESDVASMVFVASALLHIVSWVFTISRIVTLAGGPSKVTDVAAWATLASAFGAILAAFHFQRQTGILAKLWWALGRKVREAPSTEKRRAIARVRRITMTQLLLTVLRLFIGYGAAVSFPWAIAVKQFGDRVALPELIPFFIGLGVVCTALFATLFFFVVEYRVRWELSPRLGEVVCEAFRSDIEAIYARMKAGRIVQGIDTAQEQERAVWEDVAREFLHEYRFDTVFAADRFGAILQYIQSGMERRSHDPLAVSFQDEESPKKLSGGDGKHHYDSDKHSITSFTEHS